MSVTSPPVRPSIAAEVEAIVGASHLERLRGVPERCVARPASAAEVAELALMAHRRGAALVPVGNASHVTEPETTDPRPRLLVDLRRMSHVLHLDETSLIARVQTGLTAHALEAVLAPRGLTLGDFPPAALGSTIGGLLAVRTPGKASRRSGTFEDAVLGVSAVLADGRTVHTRVAPRRASGPDLARALCGSEGTLAILTSATLRIQRRPESRLLAAHALPSFADGLAAVRLALREEAAPAALRVYDAAEARAHLVISGDGMSDDRGEAVLVVATAGPTDLAACDRDLFASAAAAVGGHPLPESVAETWWQQRTGRAEAAAPPRPSFQLSATPARVAEVYEAVRAAARERQLDARAHASRFDLDGAVLFFTVTDADGKVLAADHPARAALLSAASAAGAYLLGATNPVMVPYFDALRDALDPTRVLNPGVLDED